MSTSRNRLASLALWLVGIGTVSGGVFLLLPLVGSGHLLKAGTKRLRTMDFRAGSGAQAASIADAINDATFAQLIVDKVRDEDPECVFEVSDICPEARSDGEYVFITLSYTRWCRSRYSIWRRAMILEEDPIAARYNRCLERVYWDGVASIVEGGRAGGMRKRQDTGQE